MAVQPKNKKSVTTAVVVFVIAQILVIGLLWTVFANSGDREGRIKATLATAKTGELQNAITSYYEERKTLPADNNALRQPNGQSKPYFTTFEEQGDLSYTIKVENGVITLTFSQNQASLSGKTLIFVPHISEGKFNWSCDTGSVEENYLPAQCRSQ
ncbi:MAG: pilin [Gallionellaceae bacterium]|jgi:hypothetical protein|nr:pilin [Gallionellaceae bacterium]